MKVLFMGTPDFAVPCLDELNKKHEVVGVFTKIDKVNQRGNKIKFSPVKQYALDNNIEVYQPKSVKTEETLNIVKELNPDVIVVVAYGKILPVDLIEFPKHGTLNVHASLLPKYRGASPIHSAIINGEDKSGVTIMYIAEELDAGDMLLKRETEIIEEDNLESLYNRLEVLGKEALIEALELIENGEAKAVAQDHSQATFVKPIKKEECKIDWNKSKKDIFNLVRGLNPFPTAFSILNDKRYKIYEVEKLDGEFAGNNGEIIELRKNKGPIIKVNDGALILLKVKPENKKMISGKDLINGNKLNVGEIFL